MQQQFYQEEEEQQQQQQQQPGAQDATGHQMVLCPVRVVYETQMLVQPGEQIQPNQTIFINSQNPPPWIQNSQNQVIYVQQVPNYVHPTQQYIDPNQLYLQNYGYQNLQQILIQNHQEQIQPMQITPANAVSSQQAGIGQNIQTQELLPNIPTMPYTYNLSNTVHSQNNPINRQSTQSQIPNVQIRPMQMTPANIAPNQQAGIGQNVQTQRLVPNISTMPTTYNLVNTINSQNMPMNRQTTQSQISNVNEIVSNVKQEIVTQNINRQVPQAIPQDPRNQMQQTVAIVPNNTQRPTNTYEQNVVQMQPIPQQNTSNSQTRYQTTYQNAMINVQDARKVPVAVNKNINYNVVHPNISVKGQQTFSPLQPSTNQIRPNLPQFLQIQQVPNIVQSTVPNMSNENVPRQILPDTIQVPKSITISNSGQLKVNKVHFNRKRKSKTPDKIHKMSSIINSPDNSMIIKKIENIPNVINRSNIGASTSSIHKSDGSRTINTMQKTPLSPIHAQNTKIKEELVKNPVNNPITELQYVIRNNLVVSSVPSPVPFEKEKLVRNTVSTHARRRVLNDDEPVLESNKTEVSTMNVTLNCPVPAVSTEVTQTPQTNTNSDNKYVSKVEPNEGNNATINPIKVENNPTVTEENKLINVISNINIKEDLSENPVNNPITEPQNVIRNNLVVSSVPSTVPSEKEKLVRNTVFTQARGRVLNDKEPVLETNRTEVSTINATLNCPVPAVSTEVTQTPQTNTNSDNKYVSKVEPNEGNNATINQIKVENNPTVTEENKLINVISNINIKEELSENPVNNPITEPQNVIRNNLVVSSVPITVPSEKEKLVRNTVFTQARGRVLNDKEPVLETNRTEVSTINATLNCPIPAVSTEVTQTPQTNTNNDSNYVSKVEPNEGNNATINPIKVENNPTVTEENKVKNVISNINIKEELSKNPVNNPITEPQNVIRNNLVVSSVPSTVPSEKEKLVRNTVFIQARGRVLNDKEPVLESNRTEVSTNNVTSNCPVPPVSTEVTQIPETNPNNDDKDVSKVERNEGNNATINPIKVENKPTVTEENKIKHVSSNVKATDEVQVKEDKHFILTHVLDGYVIQESNIPFPIWQPFKKKSLLPNNPDGTETNETKEINVDKDAGVKNISKILNISHLHIKDIETVVKSEKVNDKDNPFRTLKPSVVKSWTVEQLETHLIKFGWNYIASVLQEHEIDGESLLLVSKEQLLTIGVKEEHADIIREFVKSKQ